MQLRSIERPRELGVAVFTPDYRDAGAVACQQSLVFADLDLMPAHERFRQCVEQGSSEFAQVAGGSAIKREFNGQWGGVLIALSR